MNHVERFSRGLSVLSQLGALLVLVLIVGELLPQKTIVSILVLLLLARTVAGLTYGWVWRQRHPLRGRHLI